MIRLTCLAAFVGLLLVGPLRAEDNPVEAKLDVARAEFDKAIEKAEADIVAGLKAKATAAQKAGDLKALQRAEAELKAFQDDGTPPKLVSVKEYDAAVAAARVKMEAAFVAAVKQHTKDGNRELAEAAQADLDEFKKSGRPRDPFVQGSHWGAKEAKAEFFIIKRDGDAVTVRYKGASIVLNADAKVKNGIVFWAIGDVSKLERGMAFAGVIRPGPGRGECQMDFTFKDGSKGAPRVFVLDPAK